MRKGAEVLERDPHGEKVLRLTDGSILKLFRRKRLLSSAAWSPYAQRFADNAAVLARMGIAVPEIIAVFRVQELARDAVHYRPLPGLTLREMVRAGINPELERRLKDKLTRLVIFLHDQGVYFRSLHIGNVVCTPEKELGLIDFSDLRIHPWPLGKYLRARNVRRMQGIATEREWLNLDAIINARQPVEN